MRSVNYFEGLLGEILWNSWCLQVITEGVELPESNNELRKNQLRELALLNGTLRDKKNYGTSMRCWIPILYRYRYYLNLHQHRYRCYRSQILIFFRIQIWMRAKNLPKKNVFITFFVLNLILHHKNLIPVPVLLLPYSWFLLVFKAHQKSSEKNSSKRKSCER